MPNTQKILSSGGNVLLFRIHTLVTLFGNRFELFGLSFAHSFVWNNGDSRRRRRRRRRTWHMNAAETWREESDHIKGTQYTHIWWLITCAFLCSVQQCVCVCIRRSGAKRINLFAIIACFTRVIFSVKSFRPNVCLLWRISLPCSIFHASKLRASAAWKHQREKRRETSTTELKWHDQREISALFICARCVRACIWVRSGCRHQN